METRNSTGMLESPGEDSMLIETVKSIVTRDGRTESETDEDFFLVSQRYAEVENVEEAPRKQQQTDTFLALASLCRICANANDHLIPIFEGEGAEHELPDKMLKYLPIHVRDERSKT